MLELIYPNNPYRNMNNKNYSKFIFESNFRPEVAMRFEMRIGTI